MSRLTYKTDIEIYAYDVDYMGIVHNIVYLRWMEKARSDFLNPVYSYETALETGVSPVIINSNLHYLIPLRLGVKASLEMNIIEIGKAKWSVEFEISSEEGTHFKAEQYGMFFDTNRQKPTRVPKQIRDYYEKVISDESSP